MLFLQCYSIIIIIIIIILLLLLLLLLLLFNNKKKNTLLSQLIINLIVIALETLGPLGTKSYTFLRELGRRLTIVTEDPRETSFLFQRISIAVQRFNAIRIRDSFPVQVDID